MESVIFRGPLTNSYSGRYREGACPGQVKDKLASGILPNRICPPLIAGQQSSDERVIAIPDRLLGMISLDFFTKVKSSGVFFQSWKNTLWFRIERNSSVRGERKTLELEGRRQLK